MKKYNKHYLKRNPSDQRVSIEDGNPVLGDIAKKDCPLEDWHIQALNKSWKKTGIYFVEIKAKDDSAEIEKALRADLFAKANALFTDGKIEKMPAKNIKTDDLQTLINNVEE